MAAQGLLKLPQQAHLRYTETMKENDSLVHALQAQEVILDDITNSIVDVNKTSQEISSLDKELEEVEIQLNEAQDVLLELMTRSKKSDFDPGDFLKSFMSQIYDALSETCLKAIDSNQLDVSLIDMVNIEELIMKTIDTLSSHNLYPENPDDLEKRMQQSKAHAEKIIGFLKQVRDAEQQ